MKLLDINSKHVIALFFCLPYILKSQNSSSIRVIYESRVEFNQLDENLNITLKKAFAKASNQKARYVLLTNKEKSNFELIEQVDNSQNEENLGVSISTAAPFSLFKDLEKRVSLMELEALGTHYILKDTLNYENWKISKLRKNILGYEARYASMELDSISKLQAWYAPKIQIKNGPEYFDGLPGLILEAEIIKKFGDHIETTNYKAIKITNEESTEIKSPKKGKIISKSEFINEQEKYLKQMKEIYGGGVDTSD